MDSPEMSYLQVLEEQKTLFNEIFNGIERVTTKENPSPQYLRSRLDNLGMLWDKCRQFNAFLKANSLQDEVNEDGNGDVYNSKRFKEVEQAYYDCTDYILENLPGSSGVQQPERQVKGENASVLKLPRISIPQFTGEYTDWLEFRDLFNSLVIQNEALDDTQRLHYLKSVLSGEALTIVKNQSITVSNFENVWNALKARYENNRSLINAYLKLFYDLPEITSDIMVNLKKMRDAVLNVTLALSNLGLPVDQWDALLVFNLQRKLDKVSIIEWEKRNSENTDFPTFSDFTKFLDSRIRALEAMEVNRKSSDSKPKQSNLKNQKSTVHAHQANQKIVCFYCKGEHKITSCDQFKGLSVNERESHIRKSSRCLKCLGKHYQKDCKSEKTCFHCRGKHNSLLHRQDTDSSKNVKNIDESDNLNSSNDAKKCEPTITSHVSSTIKTRRSKFLATARVLVVAPNGRRVFSRALLDQCSESSFISENLAQLLRLRRERVDASVGVVGGATVGSVSHSVLFNLQSTKNTDISIPMHAFVFSKITSYISPSFIVEDLPTQFRDLELADPCPYANEKIDLLIGADVYGLVLKEGLRKASFSPLIAQETIFGWVMTGPLNQSEPTTTIKVHHISTALINETLQNFWKLEEVPKENILSAEDIECESHFSSTHTRDSDGRYVVRIPFKMPPTELGDSKKIALSALERLENKLEQNQMIKKDYSNFMTDYSSAGHMSEIVSEDDKSFRVLIPHHPVIREQSSTTKLRVVFNASSVTSSKKSLNDCLYIGQKLQNDLIAIILRWRLFQYVLVADIKQMFRQILVAPEDRKYQCIFWRKNPKDKIKVFELNTVTYGMASSPFLANRVIRQLAHDEKMHFPLGAPILENETYVDDVFIGAEDKLLALEKRNQTILLTKSAGMSLRKWSSNSKDLLNDLETTDHNFALEFPVEENSGLKILGIFWNPSDDVFRFNVIKMTTDKITKRHILSTVGKLFDPLGWLSPIIITAKILLQSLWLIKISWDDDLPPDIVTKWKQFKEELPLVSKVLIPRCVFLGHDVLTAELHGFSDASKFAYAAVVYLRVVLMTGEIKVSLLMAKSKVAPIKTVSIPRLELCAAALLAKLMAYVVKSLRLVTSPIYCWVDSEVVLRWLQKQPSTWPVFIANRVSKIQTSIPDAQWLYVQSKDNPADPASRGIAVPALLENNLWWKGPNWLSKNPDSWPKIKLKLEQKVHVHVVHDITWSTKLLDRISTWARLLRVTAYVLRFIRFIKSKDKINGPLSSNEINHASNFWVRYAQKEAFPNELNCFERQVAVPHSSLLQRLNPILDEAGILRLGGRLQHSTLPTQTKFPAILPKHRVSTLIVEQLHKNLLHAGTQLTLGVLREKFWIIGARNLVKNKIHNCVTCTRDKAKTATQFMANLPTARCSPSRPFSHTGLDYAGPFFVRTSSGRGYKSHKAYIAIFVCFSVKAVHLELVQDYSASAFLAAYKRFVSRRGLPSDMYSDNGTNFRGAERELRNALRDATQDSNLLAYLASDGTNWHFIPPSAPHFGGLWEAGVKSAKTHLKRVLGSRTPTSEEFNTVLCEIECCLNSRPLHPLSDDPNCLNVLTPGHFLVGSALKIVPEPSVLDLAENHLSRWQLLRKITEDFWRSWRRDYVHSLQQRYKWSSHQPNLKIGAIVLLKNSNLPPAKWELGRIIECNPGDDKIVRVVKVKTTNSESVRPITQLVLLPVT